MIHKYVFRDVHIVMDINSGSVHVVDPVIYDALDYITDSVYDRKAVAESLSVRYDESDIEEAFEVADGNRNYISQHFRMDDSGFTVAESLNGSETGVRVVLKGDRLSFYHGASEVAYISDQRLYISQSVVLQQMDVGVKQTETDVKGDPGKGQWSWKVHENAEGKNNLYLKWLG